MHVGIKITSDYRNKFTFLVKGDKFSYKTALIARKAKLFLQHIALAQLFILKTNLPKDKIF